MANTKRGDVVSIDHETQHVTMTNKDTGETFVAPLQGMTRPEIMSAYAFMFPGSGRLLSHTTDEMRDALLAARPISRVEDDEPRFAPAPIPAPEADIDEDTTPIPATAPATGPVAIAPDGSLESIIRVIARDEAERVVVPGDIDEDKVRDIARDEASKVAPRVTRIELKDHAPREIEGKIHPIVGTVLKMIRERSHVYLAGPAGTGKSTIAEQCAELLDLEFSSISCHPQMTGAALFGYQNATGDYVPTEFRKRFEFGGMFCIDEMDNGNPAIIASLNQALSNKVCAFPDGMIRRDDTFVAVGTGNTFGTGPNALHMGRQALDFATKTRFFGIYVPEDADIERAVIDSSGIDSDTAMLWHNVIHDLRRAVDALEMRVPVSMRHAMLGAKALAAGLTRDEALAGTVFFGVPPEQVAKIRETSGVK